MNTKSVGDLIAAEFSRNKRTLNDAEQQRLAAMIDADVDARVNRYNDLMQTLIDCKAKWDFQLHRADADESAVACAMDLANTWAREQGVEQASGLGDYLQLRNLIDRLWAKESVSRHNALDKIEKQRVELEELRGALECKS